MPKAEESLLERWNHYWFAPAPVYNLCLIRAFLGFVLLLKLTGTWGLYRFYRLRAHFPRRDEFEVGEMLETWRMPFPGLEWLPVPSTWGFARMEELLLVLAVLMTVGLFSRAVVPLTALLFNYLLLLSLWNFHHHVFCLSITLTILAFTPCGRHLSLDALLAGRGRRLLTTTILPLRLIQTQVCVIYAFTFLSKLNGGWLDGTIFEILNESGRMRGPFAEMMTSLISYQVIGMGTVFAEGMLASCFLIPRLRRIAILVGIGLHVGIDATMSVVTFSYQMMILYIAFIRPEPRATVILWDDRSDNDQRLGRRLRMLDWLGRLSWAEIGDPKVQRALPSLTPEALAHALHVVTPDGRLHQGFAAWRTLLARLPLTFVPSALLYVPGFAALVQRSRSARANASSEPETATSDAADTPAWLPTLERAALVAAGRSD